MGISSWISRKRPDVVPASLEPVARAGVRRIPFSREYVLPLAQHAGRPASPIVEVGQDVVRGEPIAKADGFFSAPLHAPVTGRVTGIGTARDQRGLLSPAITLHECRAASQDILFGAEAEISRFTPAGLIKAIANTGVINDDGVPLHVHLVLSEEQQVDTLLVNACDSVSFVTTARRVLVESTELVMQGLRVAMRAVGVTRAVIAVHESTNDAAAALAATLGDDRITVQPVCPREGADPQVALPKLLLSRTVLAGKSPVDVGCIVLDAVALAQVAELLPWQRGLFEREISISGNGVARPGDYRVPIGTPLEHVLGFVGIASPSCTIYLAGPRLGLTAPRVDIPVTKELTGVLVTRSSNGAGSKHR